MQKLAKKLDINKEHKINGCNMLKYIYGCCYFIKLNKQKYLKLLKIEYVMHMKAKILCTNLFIMAFKLRTKSYQKVFFIVDLHYLHIILK